VCPRFIPSNIKKYYCGAVIANNSGATLPALFMLRTTIEQHMRLAAKVTDKRLTGDELTNIYSASLHVDFNRQYQSLKPIYEVLSDAIHGVKDDNPTLFEDERTKVLAHFEAKEMFERLVVR